MKKKSALAIIVATALLAGCGGNSKSSNTAIKNEKTESIMNTEQIEKVEVTKIGDNHWQVYTDIVINAPAQKVWETLFNFDNAPKWSSSFQGIKGDLINGNKVIILYAFNGQVVEVPHTLSYKEGEEFGWSDPLSGKLAGFRDNHKYIVKKISDSQTRFIQTDDFKSTGVKNSDLTSQDIANRASNSYPIFNKELKKEVEKKN